MIGTICFLVGLLAVSLLLANFDRLFNRKRDWAEESRKANVEALLTVRKVIHLSREARHNKGNPRYDGEYTWARRLLEFHRKCFNSRGKKKLIAEYTAW